MEAKGLGIHVRRLLVLILAAALTFTMMPLDTNVAYAESDPGSTAEKTVTCLGVSELNDPQYGNGGWCKVYYGSKTGTPLRFKVLSTHETVFGGNTMLLDCDRIIDKGRAIYSWHYEWERSITRGHLGSILTQYFNDPEKWAISLSTKAKISTEAGDVFSEPLFEYEPLKKDRLFLLDVSEARNKRYGFPETTGNAAGRVKPGMTDYWLRSVSYEIADGVAYVSNSGSIRELSAFTDEGVSGISPALNVNLNKILFSTLVNGEAGKANAEYKLTIVDNDMTYSSSLPFQTKLGDVTRSGNEITVPFSVSGQRAANATQISVLVTDKIRTAEDAQILKYGKLDLTSGSVTSNGVGTFELPEGCDEASGENYYVYVFAEDVNEGNLADYASAPESARVPGTSISVKANPYEGYYDGKAHGIDMNVVPKNATVKYGEREGTYDSDECPTVTDVGEKTVYYEVTADGYDDPVTGSATIKVMPRPIKVSGISAEDKVYDRTTDVDLDKSSMTVEGKVQGDDIDVTVDGAFSDANAGENKQVDLEYTLSGGSAGNYVLDDSSQMTTTAAISQQPVTVSGINAYDKVIDGRPDAELDYSNVVIDGAYPGDDLFIEAVGTFDDYRTEGAMKRVSISNITLIGSDKDNYVLAETGQQDSTTADIHAQGLPQITIGGQYHIYDGRKHSLDVDVVSSYETNVSFGTNGWSSMVPAPFPEWTNVVDWLIYVKVAPKNQPGADDINTQSRFRIVPRPIAVKSVEVTKVYDGTTSVPEDFAFDTAEFEDRADGLTTDEFNDLVENDGISAKGGNAAFADAKAGDNKTVLLSGLTLDGDKAKNYSLSPNAQVTGTITKRPLTVSGFTAQDKVYDGGTDAVMADSENIKIENLVNGDKVNVKAVGSFEDADAGSDKTVNITEYELTGEDADNYYVDKVNSQKTTEASIIKKELDVEEVSVDTEYDGKYHNAEAMVKDGVAATIKYGYSEDSCDLPDSPAFKDAGSDPIYYRVTSNDSNYDDKVGELYVQIRPRSLIVTGIEAKNKNYDGNTKSELVTDNMEIDGVVSGDDVSVAATGAFESAGAGKGKKVKISYELSGEDANNYRVDKEKSQAETKADIIAPPRASKAVLVAKGISSGKKAVDLSWNNVGADRYVIYMAKCNSKSKKYKYKKVKTVSGSTFKWKKGNLSKKTSYKFYVLAQKKSGGSYKTVARSLGGHFVTGNVMGRSTNPRSLKLKKSSITLSKGKTTTIKATVKKVKRSKKLLKHAKKLRFISSDPSIATVTAGGKVKAKAKGSCKIYVQTVNGIWKTCTIKVK